MENTLRDMTRAWDEVASWCTDLEKLQGDMLRKSDIPPWMREAALHGIDVSTDFACRYLTKQLIILGTFPDDSQYDRVIGRLQIAILDYALSLLFSALVRRRTRAVNSALVNLSVTCTMYGMEMHEEEADYMDLEDVEVRPTRMNANELAKREAYLWEHDVAVMAETTGPGIKTRKKFYKKN